VSSRGGASLVVAMIVAACDGGHPHNESVVGPPIFITGVSVGPDRPMPEDGVITVAFDRYLLPSTVTRQSFSLTDASNQNVTSGLLPTVSYDPVARTVTLARQIAGRPWLTKNLTYKLFLGIPEDDSDLGGVRAIDRATLSPNQTLEIAFTVGEPNGVGTGEPTLDLCRDVTPIFIDKCSSALCHGDGNQAAAGLVLTTSSGLANTAISRVAQGANTGAVAGTPRTAGSVFGIDMPLIDPGNPGNSWLLYKVALAKIPEQPLPAPNVTCAAQAQEPSPPPFVPLVPVSPMTSDADRAALDNAVLGAQMPYPSVDVTGYGQQALTFDERENLRLWIAQLKPGAPLPECGACR